MDTPYILWSARMQGWLSNAGTYSNQRKDARHFGMSEAFDYCRIHKNNMVEDGLLPIRLEDLERIDDKR